MATVKEFVEAEEESGQQERGKLGWVLAGDRGEARIGCTSAPEVRGDPDRGRRCRRDGINPQDPPDRGRIVDHDVGNKEANDGHLDQGLDPLRGRAGIDGPSSA